MARSSFVFRRVIRRYKSHLVSAGDQGENKVVILKPELDLDSAMRDVAALASNLTRRGLFPNVEAATATVQDLSEK